MRPKPTPRRSGVLIFRSALLALTVLASGCIYSFRAGAGFPPYIRTMAVLPFENTTTRFELTQELYSVLQREVPRSLGIRAGAEEVADAVLRGTITSYTLGSPLYRPGATGDRAEVLVRDVSITVDVELVDLVENEILWEGRGVSGRGQYLEDSESEETAKEEALQLLLRQIVDGAQSNW